MPKMGLFYRSSQNNMATQTQYMQNIQKSISALNVDETLVKKCLENALLEYDLIIFAVASWQDGALQDDWEEYIKNLNEELLTKKSVAIFGLGATEVYCSNFLEAMRVIYDKIEVNGTSIVGLWPSGGYDFNTANLKATNACNNSDYKELEKYIEFSTPYFSK